METHCYWIKILLGRKKVPSYIIYSGDANCRETDSKDLHLIKSQASHFRSITTVYRGRFLQDQTDSVGGQDLYPGEHAAHSPETLHPVKKEIHQNHQEWKVVSQRWFLHFV